MNTSSSTSTDTKTIASSPITINANVQQQRSLYDDFLAGLVKSISSLDSRVSNFQFRFKSDRSNMFHPHARQIVNSCCEIVDSCRGFDIAIKTDGLNEKVRQLPLKGTSCVLYTLNYGTDDTQDMMDFRGYPNWSINVFKEVGSIAAARYFISLPEFKDFTVKPKSGGKDPGFILENPQTHVKWFFKHTGNEALEYFICQCFNYLDIKYPEAKLLQDNGGNLWLATLDMSRSYRKGEDIKQKTFKTIQDHFFGQNKIFNYNVEVQDIAEVNHNPGDADATERLQLNYEFFSKRVKTTEHASVFEGKKWSDLGTNEELEAKYKGLIKQFVKEDEEAFMTSYKGPQAKAARITFAKCLIVREIFSILDMGGHAGNFGLITTTAGSKTVEKIGLVDFSQAAFIKRYEKKPVFIGDYEHKATPSLTAFAIGAYKINKMIPVLKEVAKLIPVNEMKAALQALLKPKQRVANNEGYLLTNGQTTDYTTCIGQAFSNFLEAMQGVTMEGKDELIRSIRECKDIYIERMKAAEAWFVAEPAQKQEHLNAFKAREVEQQVIPSSFYNRDIYKS